LESHCNSHLELEEKKQQVHCAIEENLYLHELIFLQAPELMTIQLIQYRNQNFHKLHLKAGFHTTVNNTSKFTAEGERKYNPGPGTYGEDPISGNKSSLSRYG
jgi:hypothetical protein